MQAPPVYSVPFLYFRLRYLQSQHLHQQASPIIYSCEASADLLYVHRLHVLHYRRSLATATAYDLDKDKKDAIIIGTVTEINTRSRTVIFWVVLLPSLRFQLSINGYFSLGTRLTFSIKTIEQFKIRN
jgi:hypothetical protein